MNFEPTEGEILVTPESGEGYSLDTEFRIRAVNFTDEDTPLTYRFFFYSEEGLYQEERSLGVNPVNSRRDFLGDSGFRSELVSRLPIGTPSSNSSLTMKVLVVVSVSDSLGAVTNSTKLIRVSNKHSSFGEQLTLYESFY